MESRIRLLPADCQQESWTVYNDGFRACERHDEDDAFTCEYVVHGDGECVDGYVHVNMCESHRRVSDAWLSPHRGVSQDRLIPYFGAFQLCREMFRKSGGEALKIILETVLRLSNNLRHKSDRIRSRLINHSPYGG